MGVPGWRVEEEEGVRAVTAQDACKEGSESSSGSLRLDGHVAGATEAGGTAGSGEGRHVAHVAVRGPCRHVVAASPLFSVHLPFGLEVGFGVVGSRRPVGMYFHLHLTGSFLHCESLFNAAAPRWELRELPPPAT